MPAGKETAEKHTPEDIVGYHSKCYQAVRNVDEYLFIT